MTPITAPPQVTILLSLPEVQHRLGIGRTKVFELMASGALESVHIGRVTRIPSDAVDGYIERLRGRTGAPADEA